MKTTVTQSPSVETITEWFETRQHRNATVSLFVRCEVVYDGRASSELATGDRFILCKPDNAFAVHTDTGHDPQNWMPPGGSITITDTDPVTITVERSDPDEIIDVICDEVYHGSFMQLEDTAELHLQGSERDLQEHIFNNPDVFENGFRATEMERETPAGPIDIWGYDTNGTPTVLELKRQTAGPGDAEQLQRYMKHLDANARGVLIAPSVSDRAEALLAEHGLESAEIEPPSAGRDESTSLSEFT